jgi:hypothetical protein
MFTAVLVPVVGTVAMAAGPLPSTLGWDATPPRSLLDSTPRRARALRIHPLAGWSRSVGIYSTLERLGVFQTQPRRVEAQSPAAIRRYVALGYGIGLIAISSRHQPDPDLHKRSMADGLGCLTVFAIRQKGAIPPAASRESVARVRAIRNQPQSPGKRGGSPISPSDPLPPGFTAPTIRAPTRRVSFLIPRTMKT